MTPDTLAVIQKAFKSFGKRPAVKRDAYGATFTYNGFSTDLKDDFDRAFGRAEVDTSHRDASVYRWKSGVDLVEAFQGVGGKSLIKVKSGKTARARLSLRVLLATEGLL